MSEERQDLERYVLEIGAVTVWIQDTVTGKRVDCFTGPDRLLNATAKLNRLKAEEITAATLITPEVAAKWLRQEEPSVFLADLAGYARRQRLTAMLKQVQEIEAQAAALLADDARRLADATALRRRLEKMLECTVSPLSESLSDQQPEVRDQGTANPELLRELFKRWGSVIDEKSGLLSKPQPY